MFGWNVQFAFWSSFCCFYLFQRIHYLIFPLWQSRSNIYCLFSLVCIYLARSLGWNEHSFCSFSAWTSICLFFRLLWLQSLSNTERPGLVSVFLQKLVLGLNVQSFMFLNCCNCYIIRVFFCFFNPSLYSLVNV